MVGTGKVAEVALGWGDMDLGLPTHVCVDEEAETQAGFVPYRNGH